MKVLRKPLSFFLCMLLLAGLLPTGVLNDILPEAKAYGVSGYNAAAAVQWAQDHWNDTDSVLLGTGYWEPGTGDCANFVSQCIFMGGVDVTAGWHTNGYLAHYLASTSDGSWIRATQLHNYVVSIGGQDIVNPSASQVAPGDLIFYQSAPGSARYNHSAIVVDVIGGTVLIAYHSDRYIKKNRVDWRLDRFSPAGTHLVKMYGGTCTDKVVRSIDVYTAPSGGVSARANPSWGSEVCFITGAGEYYHVFEKQYSGGVTWGKTYGYNSKRNMFYWAWLPLSSMNYKNHYDTGPIYHLMGEWYQVVAPTCSTVGVEERVCSRCGYKERRNMAIGGAHRNLIPATCTEAAYCTACGQTVSPALGHDFRRDTARYIAPTCLEEGLDARTCSRCGVKNDTVIPALGHDYEGTPTAPTCVADGISTLVCSRCGDSYVQYTDENNKWSAWTTQTPSEVGLSGNKVRSKQQWRYSDKSTTTSYDTYISGWTRDGGSWVHVGNGNKNYSPDQPAALHNNGAFLWIDTSPYTAYETETDKRTVTNNWDYYVYFHWCRGTYTAGPTDRFIANDSGPHTAEDGTYLGTFHYFTSKENKSFNSGGNAYKFANAAACTDSYWYKRFNHYTSYYSDYKMLFNYYRWSDWSSWQDTSVSSSGSRKVETRTVYSYDLAALGHDFTVETEKQFVAEPRLLSMSELNAACYTKGLVCSRCGTASQESNTFTHIIADYDVDPEAYALISSEDDPVQVYRTYCENGCGCYYDVTVSNCVFEETAVPATCTLEGYTLHTCSVHGETFKTDIVPALGHEADGQWETVSMPTCDSDGLRVCKCVRHDNGETCDKVFEEIIPAAGHSLVKTAAVPATCEKDGNTEYYTCDYCGRIFSDAGAVTEIDAEDTVIPATGHDGSVWTVEIEGKCGVAKIERLYCEHEWCDTTSECGYGNGHAPHHYLIKERVTPAEDHDFELVEAVDSTCITTGYEKYVCSKCGLEEVYELALADHTFGEPVNHPANCTQSGYDEYICVVCGYTAVDHTVEAPGHAKSPLDEGYEGSSDKMELISSVPNVCGGGTVDTYRCTHVWNGTRCDYTVVIGNAQDHAPGDWVTSIEPTCTEPGYRHKECQNEGCVWKTADEPIPPLGHVPSDAAVTKATCTQDGAAIITCERCETILENNTIPARNHDLSAWETVTEATCENEGLERRYCLHTEETDEYIACSYAETRPVPALGHDWGDWTEKDENEHERVCKRDASHIETEAHNWDDGVVTIQPKAEQPGEITYTCETCGAVKTEPISAKGWTVTFVDDDDSDLGTQEGATLDEAKGKQEEPTKEADAQYTYTFDHWELVSSDEDEGTAEFKAVYTNTVNEYTVTFKDEDGTVLRTEKVEYGKGATAPADPAKAPDNDKHYEFAGWDKDFTNITGDLTVTATYTGEAHTGIENVITPATCTEQGVKETVCSGCGKKLGTETISPTGHDWGEWVTVKESTIDEPGQEKRVCRNDPSHVEYRDTDVIPSYTATFVVVNEDGSKTVVDEVRFPQGATVINEPGVPDKGSRYVGMWEDYTLGDADIEIKAVYELKSSDNESELETEKKVVYADGVASITLSAFAQTINAKVRYGAEPVDVIMVLDTSGSMTNTMPNGETRLAVLKRVAKNFIETISANAAENDVDHRIALVSFNSAAKQLTGTKGNYSSALLNAGSASLISTINNLATATGTRPDTGLDVAKGILTATKDDGRDKMVVFLTDGEPTDLSKSYASYGFADHVATNAIGIAREIKRLGADIYSIGVSVNATPGAALVEKPTNTQQKMNKFMHFVSSNYPDSSELNIGGARADDSYFITADDADKLAKIFDNIIAQRISNTITFSNITLVDTISKYFTLTQVQEAALRSALAREYGVTNSQVSVTKNADGTTTVRIGNVSPKAVYVNGTQTGYGVTVTYEVSANETAIAEGKYTTDTTAEVEKNGVVVAQLDPEAVGQIDSSLYIVRYVLDGEVYAIQTTEAGATIVPPQLEYATFAVGDNSVVSDRVTTITAGYTGEKHTVTWVVNENETTAEYFVGQRIIAPDVTAPDGFIFTGWDGAVPYRMGTKDLTFNARLIAHTHEYTVAISGSCATGLVTTHTCYCGDSYVEKSPACEHTYTAHVVNTEDVCVASISCAICGEVYQAETVINYKAAASSRNNASLYDLTLTADGVSIQPDGTIVVQVALDNSTLISARMLYAYRITESGRERVTVTKEGSFAYLYLDHFSYYAITADESAVPDYGETVCAFNGHSYVGTVIAPTCTEAGFTVYTCESCGDSYTGPGEKAKGHTDANGDGLCDECGEKTGSGSSDSGDTASKCKWCGKVHTGFFGKLIEFFHNIFYFFAHLFGRK